jgi:hypothetical protein
MATQKSFTKKQINTAIDSQLADNTSQAITAANVRSIVKDYITESTAAPLLIYAGVIKGSIQEGYYDGELRHSLSGAGYIHDHYYNPDFFQKQNETDPTNADNIWQLSTTLTVGTDDGTYTIKSANFINFYTGDLLELKFTVASNIVTKMEIIAHGVGQKVDENLVFRLGSGPQLSVSYNGVIRKTIISQKSSFIYMHELTENSDNLYKRHSSINTIISASEKLTTGWRAIGYNRMFSDISGSYGRFTLLHEEFNSDSIYFEGQWYNDRYDYDFEPQHIQIYRVAGTELSRSGF